MTFDVLTTALRTYKNSLQAWSADTATATAYVGSHTHLEWSDAMMFQNVVHVNDQVVTALEAAVARIKLVTHECGLELEAAARMYDLTDHEVAQANDRLYEEVKVAPGTGYADTSSPPPDTVPKPPDDSPGLPPASGAGSGGGGGGGGSW